KILEYSHIEYIARMDSDDISLPLRLKIQRDYLENHPDIDILGTACEEFGTPYALAEKRLPSEHDDLVTFSITRCPFIHPSVMFRRRIFEEGNRYPTHTCFTEDMAFWLELLYKNYKFHNLPDVLLRYRLEENTMARRAGLSKAKSEVALRLGYMFLLNKFSLKNMLLIYSRYCFHLLPPKLMSLAYKYLR
ncbi:glycosyl transferase 2 family protein, partial [Providencia rettgeri]|nr:glycosyl transferase 2 family protein [Providencia rettgeri]